MPRNSAADVGMSDKVCQEYVFIEGGQSVNR